MVWLIPVGKTLTLIPHATPHHWCTFTDVYHTTTSTQDNQTIRNQFETNYHGGRCLTSEMTRKQGPILSRMVPQCVVLVQIGVEKFPCGVTRPRLTRGSLGLSPGSFEGGTRPRRHMPTVSSATRLLDGRRREPPGDGDAWGVSQPRCAPLKGSAEHIRPPECIH